MTCTELLDSLSTWSEVGRSALGRSLRARDFPGDPAAPAVLLFGAIHGDEPLGAYCLRWLADELAARAAPLPRTAWLLPVANPDALLAQRKNNARGVDLNRNFPAANWRPNPEARYHSGPAPASEPETQALCALIDRIGARRLVALHSPFRTVNYDGPARELAERMGALNGYGASADIGYPTPGSFGSLYGIDRQLEVITLEIPPMSPSQAWTENRAALYAALDLSV